MAIKELKMPDLLTFDGLPGLGLVESILPKARKKGEVRSEIYEIKPWNDKGRYDALKKLDAIEKSYTDAGLSDIYLRGLACPAGSGTTRIERKTPFIKTLICFLNLQLVPLKVSV